MLINMLASVMIMIEKFANDSLQLRAHRIVYSFLSPRSDGEDEKEEAANCSITRFLHNSQLVHSDSVQAI